MSANKSFDRYIKSEKGKAAIAASRAKNVVKVTTEFRRSTDKDILEYLPEHDRPAFIRSSIRIAHATTSNLFDAARVVSRILKIEQPRIVFCGASEMPTSTSSAKSEISDEEVVVYLNIEKHDEPLEFSLIHELRHIFQYQYFLSHDDYRAEIWESEFNSPAPKNLREYNLRDIELDANAFAAAIYFLPRECTKARLRAFTDFLFFMLDDDIKNKIFARALRFLHVK